MAKYRNGIYEFTRHTCNVRIRRLSESLKIISNLHTHFVAMSHCLSSSRSRWALTALRLPPWNSINGSSNSSLNVYPSWCSSFTSRSRMMRCMRSFY